VSEMAMVPDREWRIPTLIGSVDSAPTSEGKQATVQQDAKTRSFKWLLLFMDIFSGCGVGDEWLAKGNAAHAVPFGIQARSFPPPTGCCARGSDESKKAVRADSHCVFFYT